MTFHAFWSLEIENGIRWGPKDWKRSPWGPRSPNGDPFGSSAEEIAKKLQSLPPSNLGQSTKNSVGPSGCDRQNCWVRRPLTRLALWAKAPRGLSTNYNFWSCNIYCAWLIKGLQSPSLLGQATLGTLNHGLRPLFCCFITLFGAGGSLDPPEAPWCPHDSWYVNLGHSQSFWVIMSHIWPIWSE